MVGGDCGWLKHLVQAERETVSVEDAGDRGDRREDRCAIQTLRVCFVYVLCVSVRVCERCAEHRVLCAEHRVLCAEHRVL